MRPSSAPMLMRTLALAMSAPIKLDNESLRKIVNLENLWSMETRNGSLDGAVLHFEEASH